MSPSAGMGARHAAQALGRLFIPRGIVLKPMIRAMLKQSLYHVKAQSIAKGRISTRQVLRDSTRARGNQPPYSSLNATRGIHLQYGNRGAGRVTPTKTWFGRQLQYPSHHVRSFRVSASTLKNPSQRPSVSSFLSSLLNRIRSGSQTPISRLVERLSEGSGGGHGRGQWALEPIPLRRGGRGSQGGAAGRAWEKYERGRSLHTAARGRATSSWMSPKVTRPSSTTIGLGRSLVDKTFSTSAAGAGSASSFARWGLMGGLILVGAGVERAEDEEKENAQPILPTKGSAPGDSIAVPTAMKGLASRLEAQDKMIKSQTQADNIRLASAEVYSTSTVRKALYKIDKMRRGGASRWSLIKVARADQRRAILEQRRIKKVREMNRYFPKSTNTPSTAATTSAFPTKDGEQEVQDEDVTTYLLIPLAPSMVHLLTASETSLANQSRSENRTIADPAPSPVLPRFPSLLDGVWPLHSSMDEHACHRVIPLINRLLNSGHLSPRDFETEPWLFPSSTRNEKPARAEIIFGPAKDGGHEPQAIRVAFPQMSTKSVRKILNFEGPNTWFHLYSVPVVRPARPDIHAGATEDIDTARRAPQALDERNGDQTGMSDAAIWQMPRLDCDGNTPHVEVHQYDFEDGELEADVWAQDYTGDLNDGSNSPVYTEDSDLESMSPGSSVWRDEGMSVFEADSLRS